MSNQYKTIAKSSGIIAIVQFFQMLFGLIRNKAIALLIGTRGFGIWSLYQTFLEMMTSFSTLGMDQSGVREIAKVTEDLSAVRKTIFTFRTAILAISVVNSILVLIFADSISKLLFGTTHYSTGVSFLALTIILYAIAKSSYSILNAFHELKYIARSQILAAIIGSVIAVAIVYFTKDKFIAIALSVVILVLAAANTWYVLKLNIGREIPNLSEYKSILKQLAYIGIGFTVAGLFSTVMTLLSREYLNSHYQLDSVGIYQASFTIANIYVGIILSAMGVDFMPRISKISYDNDGMNLMINQQIEFGVVVSSIGISIVILLAPIILTLLYTGEFVIGTTIIRWQILGVTLRVIAFPFSYSIIAKGKSIQYALTQIVFWMSDYLLLRLFSQIGGFKALGINYFVAYLLYLFITYYACYRNHAFSFTSTTIKAIFISIIFIVIIWISTFLLHSIWLYVVGGIVWGIQVFWVAFYVKTNMNIDLAAMLKSMLNK